MTETQKRGYRWKRKWIGINLSIVEHFSELVTKYAGRYVAVVNETLVAVGDSRRDVETKAREVEPEKIPSVLRVPGKRIWCA